MATMKNEILTLRAAKAELLAAVQCLEDAIKCGNHFCEEGLRSSADSAAQKVWRASGILDNVIG